MKHRNLIITVSVMIVLILLFVFLTSGRGQISITLPETPNTQTTISVYDDNGELAVSQSIESQKSSVQLKPGSYFVVIESNNGSYIEFIEVNGFMRSTKIKEFSLKEQLGREFVAERQKSCFSETSLGVFSYTCLGPLSSLVLHEKATDSQPPKTTSTETNSVNKNRIIEAVHETEDSVFVMAYSSERENLHDVYKLTKNQNAVSLSLIDSIRLGSQPLQQQKTSYSENSVTLVSSSDVYGGDSLRKLQRLVSPLDFGPNTTSVERFNDGSWVTLEEISTSSNPPTTNYIVRLADKDKRVEVEKPSYFAVCSNNLFVLDRQNRLSIFSPELKLEKKLSGVSDFLCVDNKPHVVLDNKLIVLSVENYKIKGFVAVNSPTLTINNAKQYNSDVFIEASFTDKDVLLKLSESAKKTDSLLSDLTSSKYVSSLSVAGSTIFVSLELGERVADPVTGEYDYNQNNIANAEKEIRQIIAEILLVDSSLVFNVPLLD